MWKYAICTVLSWYRLHTFAETFRPRQEILNTIINKHTVRLSYSCPKTWVPSSQATTPKSSRTAETSHSKKWKTATAWNPEKKLPPYRWQMGGLHYDRNNAGRCGKDLHRVHRQFRAHVVRSCGWYTGQGSQNSNITGRILLGYKASTHRWSESSRKNASSTNQAAEPAMWVCRRS